MIFSICHPSQKGEAGTALVIRALVNGGYEQVGHISVCNSRQRVHAFMKCAELDWDFFTWEAILRNKRGKCET